MHVRSLLSLATTLAILAGGSAGAAGDTTHALMADRATGFVRTPELAALLAANRDAFLGGALYPDSGYWTRGAGVPGGDYGEVSHWEPFINAYVNYLRSRPDCAPLNDPAGPCAASIAHVMGAAAHGMGDEVWDWLFEPLVTDHGEQPAHPIAGYGPLGQLPLGSLIGSIEYAMDMIAIKDYWLWAEIPHSPPPVDDLVAVYHSMGRDDITPNAIRAGFAMESGILAAERVGAIADGERVRAQMPWSAAHFYSESGGVIFSARAIAGYLEGIWRKLLSPTHPAPRVIAAHPEHGESGVPWRWQPARTSPGPDSGGGENRIVAVLSNSLDPASVPSGFFLFGPDGGLVEPMLGFPHAGPWGPDGTHTMLFYPAADLEPCSVYTAVVTVGLHDHAGAPLGQNFTWSFETGPGVGAGACS